MSDNIKTKICDACNLYKNYYYTLTTASYIPSPVGLAAKSVIKSGEELCKYCSMYDTNKLIVTEHAQQLLESYSQAMNIYKSVMDKYNQQKLVLEESVKPIVEPVALESVERQSEGGYKRKKSRKRKNRSRSKRKQSRLSKRKSIKKKSKKNRRR